MSLLRVSLGFTTSTRSASRTPRGRLTSTRSRGDLPTGRAVEVATRSAPAARRRRGIGLVRRGRDRVRDGAASNQLQRVERRTPGLGPLPAPRWRAGGCISGVLGCCGAL